MCLKNRNVLQHILLCFQCLCFLPVPVKEPYLATTMKVFFSILPILTLCCVNRAADVETSRECDSSSTPIMAIPGQSYNMPSVTLDKNQHNKFYVSFNPDTVFSFYKSSERTVNLTIYAPPEQEVCVTLNNITQTITHASTVSFKIIMLLCPPGFEFDETKQACKCSNQTKLYAIECDETTFSAKIAPGFCVSRENYTSSESLLIIPCPFKPSRVSKHVYIPLKQDENGSTKFCSKLNRQHRLCKECIPGYGISVFSYAFDCIKCAGNRQQHILAYLAIGFIPATILFLVVLYFHIGVTKGPANGFIFFSQIITLPAEIAFLQSGLGLFFALNKEDNYLAKMMTKTVTCPYSIWNLEFYCLLDFNNKICLSKDLKAINILALSFVSAVYPLVLLLVAYIIIELQAMNIRPIVWLLKIACFPCTRWRRVWKARLSIVDAFATYVLLSYTKLMYVSFLLLSYSKIYGGHSSSRKVLDFDPSITYLSREHTPYVILSVVVILVFGLLPPLLLTFYQCKTCASCLERLHMRRPGLEQFVEAFQGCYKDGANGTADRRFFAGVYFVFRVIILLLYSQIKQSVALLPLKAFAFILFLFVCAVSQPYKKAIYTFIDCLFFALLSSISIMQFYGYGTLKQEDKVDRNFFLYYFALYIPLFYIICYLARRLFRYYKNRDSDRYLLLDNGDDIRETTPEQRNEHMSPVHINISPRTSITRTEVSIAELSHERNCSDSESMVGESSPLLKKREMLIFSQHAATLSQDT